MLFEASNVNIDGIRADIRMEIEGIRRRCSNPRSHFSVVSDWSCETDDLEGIGGGGCGATGLRGIRGQQRRELSHTRDNDFVGGIAFVEQMQFVGDEQFNVLARNGFSVFPSARVDIPILRSGNNDIVFL